ncbi:MAG: alpha/beta hydrolase family protein [Prosthecobacter sp.]
MIRPLLPLLLATSLQAQLLPGTQPLEPNPDFSATMVAGIDKMALRLIEQSKTGRKPTREKLKAIIGAVDERLPITALELVGDTSSPALLAETDTARILRVRWPVFDGVHGEGILIQPKDKPVARVIYIPDADTDPEKLANDAMLAYSGCEIVIPALISRSSEFSTNDKFGVKTNVPHREWIYRQSYELGRHIIGYEVQKMLSLVDYFGTQPKLPLLVAGLGEGGLIAMYSGAIDERISSVYVWGCFEPREGVWAEPIYRNVFNLLRDFGDAEVASLIGPRPLVVQNLGFPNVQGPPKAKPGEREIAAPGKITKPTLEAVKAEVARAKALVPGDWLMLATEEHGLKEVVAHLLPADVSAQLVKRIEPIMPQKNEQRAKVDVTRQKRMVRELETFTQRLLVSTEMERKAQFWDKLPLKSVAEFEKHTAGERDRFWNEVIGRLPDPSLPANARSRFVRETDKVKIYEVTMDVWDDVFAWGWLCLPKDLKPGEKRPVVVCQHGLEGIPEDTITTNETQKAYAPYKGFTLRLAEQGFITFAPHNPYRGKDAFRTLQRKLNPLGLTLYSVINGQHQRILEWLKAQPFTQPEKIAFYGLSYGGKSAMRTPAVLTDYCLSICSGDFNEWVRKCVSTDMPMSYIHTHEYEIWEWNMGRTFNYAEMAALIAPRPFMVERGHNDGVGLDEWVNYEFAKVRRLYNKLQIGDRTTIEHFDGPHTIHGVGTFEFLKQKLDWK